MIAPPTLIQSIPGGGDGRKRKLYRSGSSNRQGGEQHHHNRPFAMQGSRSRVAAVPGGRCQDLGAPGGERAAVLPADQVGQAPGSCRGRTGARCRPLGIDDGLPRGIRACRAEQAATGADEEAVLLYSVQRLPQRRSAPLMPPPHAGCPGIAGARLVAAPATATAFSSSLNTKVVTKGGGPTRPRADRYGQNPHASFAPARRFRDQPQAEIWRR